MSFYLYYAENYRLVASKVFTACIIWLTLKNDGAMLKWVKAWHLLTPIEIRGYEFQFSGFIVSFEGEDVYKCLDSNAAIDFSWKRINEVCSVDPRIINLSNGVQISLYFHIVLGL